VMRRRINKKGFEASQMFVYILSIVVVGLVLLFGTRAIMGWKEDIRKVNYVQFKTDLKNVIEDVAADYGSVKQKSFNIPGEYKRVCFADIKYPMSAGGDLIIDGVNYPEIKDAWTDDPPTANIFLLDESSAQESFLDDRIQIEINDNLNDFHIICIPRESGKLKVRLEGLGRSVKIGRWRR